MSTQPRGGVPVTDPAAQPSDIEHDVPGSHPPQPACLQPNPACAQAAQAAKAAQDMHQAPGPADITGQPGNVHAPQCLPHTDWLHHRLTVTGPAPVLAGFQTAARGSGVIPWTLDLDRLEEDWLHLLAAPPAPQQRTLSLRGARILAGQLRAAVARRHDLAVAQVERSRACPLDLHRLVPIPEALLRRGPDTPAALDWLWRHWGTTLALRHVAVDAAARASRPDRQRDGETVLLLTFWSADWTPWRALHSAALRWPELRFDIRPSYEGPA